MKLGKADSPRNALPDMVERMKAEFTAIIEAAPEGGYWAICPEVPGANGQGETVAETKKNLVEAIQLIFEDRRADILRGLPEDAIQEKISVG
jgi:predicted RNase H-like HicB family nuclease